MATACTHASAHFTRTSKPWLDTERSRSRAKTPGSSHFEVIDGMLYRRKLEKGFINYREVLDEERRHEAIASFHRRRPGQRHLTLEETYKCVAENYWWEGMYFQIRDVVLGCAECRNQKRKKNQVSLPPELVGLVLLVGVKNRGEACSSPAW
ncbi:zinc finger and BTB domain-containing protein 11 [Neosynchiropus ocellatus]